MPREEVSIALSHPTLDELVGRTNAWIAENSKGDSDTESWEAARAVLADTTYFELGDALQEILAVAAADDGDARDVVAAFTRLHPPQSLSNPERQRSLIGNYLILRQKARPSASDQQGDLYQRRDLTQTSS